MASLTKLPLVARLSDRVIRILACNPGFMTLQGTNTYLVGTGPKRLLIDTGDGKQPQYMQLLKYVLGKENATIENIFITHWHEDHLGGLSGVKYFLQQQLGCNEPSVWKGKRKRDETLSPPEHTLVYTPFENFRPISIGDATVSCIHTPGHTTDHYSFYLKEDDAIFSGDCVLGEGTTVFESLPVYLQSLHKLLNLNPKIIYPGHGPMVKNGTAYIQKYIDHREERDSDITYLLDQMGRPLTEKEITKRIHKDLPEELINPAVSNVLEHLMKLKREGRVHGSKGEWYTHVFYD